MTPLLPLQGTGWERSTDLDALLLLAGGWLTISTKLKCTYCKIILVSFHLPLFCKCAKSLWENADLLVSIQIWWKNKLINKNPGWQLKEIICKIIMSVYIVTYWNLSKVFDWLFNYLFNSFLNETWLYKLFLVAVYLYCIFWAAGCCFLLSTVCQSRKIRSLMLADILSPFPHHLQEFSVLPRPC